MTLESDADRNAIREQLERILAHPLFKNSKRYPKMLRFVVERSLTGQTELLKERTLGVEVFGRDPEYDTNLDPVVRITAGEIRKRIAQYYHESGHEAELRIDFPPGSYLPEFRLPQAAPAAAPFPVLPSAPESIAARNVSPVWTRWAGIALAAFAMAVVLLWAPWRARPAIERFWSPILGSSEPVLIYIGPSYPDQTPEEAVTLTDLHKAERVGFADAAALAHLATYLAVHNRPYRLRFQSPGQIDELREGPAVLIGGFSNTFTLRLTGETRFSFVRDAEGGTVGIRDRENPQSMQWFRSMNNPYKDLKEDYAIVSRVWDPTTGRVAVTVAGLAKFGTAAAGEFLTTPAYMQEINSIGPKDWDRKNIEVVISTAIVGKTSGPPHVLAAHFW